MSAALPPQGVRSPASARLAGRGRTLAARLWRNRRGSFSEGATSDGLTILFMAFMTVGAAIGPTFRGLDDHQARTGERQRETREERFRDLVRDIPDHVEEVARWMLCAEQVQAPLTPGSLQTSPYVARCGGFPRPPLDGLRTLYPGGVIPPDMADRYRFAAAQVEHHDYTLAATRWFYDDHHRPHLMPRPSDWGVSLADALP